MFDFSNYSIKSKYHGDSNKLLIGKMKDETGGVAIEEFVGLKPKFEKQRTYEFCQFFLSDFLSLKFANTPTQKHPREQNVLIHPDCILLTQKFLLQKLIHLK